LVPDGVYQHFSDQIGRRGGDLQAKWTKLREGYAAAFPDLARQLDAMLAGGPPEGWDSALPTFELDAKGVATRESSGKALNAVAKHYPWMIGGAADLSPSTKTNLTFEGASAFEAGKYGGVNLHFGVREHAMGAIVNGLALSGLRPFGATFLIFSDYMKPPIRLSALMEQPAIYIFTHDSIGLGEDGPTHQPVEQLVSLRSVPGLVTLRPADANEAVEAWRVIGGLTKQPAALILSRQPLPTFDRGVYAPASGVAKGAYVLADAQPGEPEVILIGTGSEVHLCVEVYETLKAEGVAARVVSMPSWDLFEKQDQAYRDSVLPPKVTARVSVEMASIIGWDRYVGRDGAVIGMHTLGSSAPIKDLLKKFGFTVDKVLEAARRQIAKAKETAQ
jgi:transketolase